MELLFLETAQPGLRWLRRYYVRNPQLSKQKAAANFSAARALIRENPFIGHPYEEMSEVREHPIRGTNFTIVYTVARDTIWVIDIRDVRGLRSAEALRQFTRELRERLRD
jgi:hypothetical protein